MSRLLTARSRVTHHAPCPKVSENVRFEKTHFAQAHAGPGVVIFIATAVGHGAGSMSPNAPRRNALLAKAWPRKELRIRRTKRWDIRSRLAASNHPPDERIAEIAHR